MKTITAKIWKIDENSTVALQNKTLSRSLQSITTYCNHPEPTIYCLLIISCGSMENLQPTGEKTLGKSLSVPFVQNNMYPLVNVYIAIENCHL